MANVCVGIGACFRLFWFVYSLLTMADTESEEDRLNRLADEEGEGLQPSYYNINSFPTMPSDALPENVKVLFCVRLSVRNLVLILVER